jgi:hypothetical protein
MTTNLVRKGIQVELDVYNEIQRRIGLKTEKLAKQKKPHRVTASEVIADAFGMEE